MTDQPATDRAELRDRIAAALYERERPPRDPAWADAYAMDREVFEAMADTVLAVLPAATNRAVPDLTAEEASTLADDLGLELYRAQDALAFVEECCVIADRERRTVTTADVREWLKGARCGRQLAADAADRAGLRVRIAEAIHIDLTEHKARRDQGLLGIVPRLADAVLAVLPASIDRAIVLDRIRALHQPKPDGSGFLDALQCRTCSHDGGDGYQYLVPWPCPTVEAVDEELRRMTDETPQPECEAQPPYHRWYVETLDDLANEWAPGQRFTDRSDAVERYQTVSEHHPLWKDGTPVQRRLVRETASYTVEPAAGSAGGARPSKEGLTP